MRVVLLSLFVLLLAGTAVRGQSNEAVEELIAELTDDDPRVRQDAAAKLVGLGSNAAPALVVALFGDHPDLRIPNAAQAILAEIGGPAVPALIESLSWEYSFLAAEPLGQIGAPAIPSLIEALGSKNPKVREAAASAVSEVPHGAAGEIAIEFPALIPALINGLAHEDVRYSASKALTRLGVPAVPALTDALAGRFRYSAASALEEIGAPAIPALIRSLSHRSSETREWIAGLLAKLKAPAIPALIEALSDPDPNVRHGSAQALRQVGPEAEFISTLTPALIKALSDVTPGVRDEAAQALGAIGAPAIPGVIEALAGGDPSVRKGATAALAESLRALPTAPTAQIPELIRVLIPALSDTDKETRRQATDALETIGAPTVPALIPALSDPNADVRRAAAEILSTIGPQAAPAEPALIQALLADNDDRTRAYAADALGKAGVDRQALWWVLPRVYWKETCGLLGVLVLWFLFASRFPRHRPADTQAHLMLIASTAYAPVAWTVAAIFNVTTLEWTQGLLPDTHTLLPLPVAAALTMGLATTLPAIWVCQRKDLDPNPEEPADQGGEPQDQEA